MFDRLKSPIIFAHRGASAHAPENTIAAFELALQHKADGIELDAKLTKDNHVVVIHDQSLNRTTDGEGLVRKTQLSDLKKRDAGSKFSEKFSGEKIPTLNEVFEVVGKKMVINVELTNYASPHDLLPKLAAELVIAHGLQEWVLFSSFFFTNLIRVKRIIPHARVALLAWEGNKGFPARSRLSRWVSPEYIHPFLKDVSAEYIRQQHQNARRVNVWTVNKSEDMRNLFHWQVDGIFTDDPALAVQIRGEK